MFAIPVDYHQRFNFWYFATDCTGYSQSGLKWIKKLHAKSAGEAAVAAAWDDLVPTYEIHNRWKTFIFTVPPELRGRLPIPGGYEKVPWIYTFIPFPGKESKNFVVDRIEGHRGKRFLVHRGPDRDYSLPASPVRISCGGWGDSPIPEGLEELKDYISEYNVVGGPPEWLATLTEMLIEGNTNVDIIAGKNRMKRVFPLIFKNG